MDATDSVVESMVLVGTKEFYPTKVGEHIFLQEEMNKTDICKVYFYWKF